MSDAIRIPPHNDEAEQACLGAVMLDNRLWSLLLTRLKRDSFYRPSHRLLFDVFSALHKRGCAIEVLTVGDELLSMGKFEEIGKMALVTLSNACASPSSLPYYLDIVANDAAQRRYLAELDRISSAIWADELDAAGIARALSDTVGADSAHKRRQNTRGAEEIGAELRALVDDEIDPSKAGGGWSTGIEQLDQMLGGGIKPGRAYYFGALSKMGKTTLAVGVTAHLLFDQEVAVDYVSMEQSRADMASKFVAWRSGVDRAQMVGLARMAIERPGDFGDHEFAKLSNAKHRFDGALHEFSSCGRCWITSEGSPNCHEIALMARARQLELATRGLDPRKYVLVCDYIQSFTAGNAKQDDVARIAEVSRVLSGIAHDLDCAVICLFQFTKEAENAYTKYGAVPRFSDAKGSSQMTNDASAMVIFHRHYREHDQASRRTHCLLKLELSRDGRDGSVCELKVDLARCRFERWEGDSLRSEIEQERERSSSRGRQ